MKMVSKKLQIIPYRRKREGRTDYKKRLALLKSKKPRLVIRKSNKHIMAQLVEYDSKGDRVILTAHTKELSKHGWKLNCSNIPSAYLLGLLIGTKARGKEAIIDTGLQVLIKGSRVFAVLKGAIDGGLIIQASEEVYPSDERILGRHIASYAKQKHKSGYENIEEHFKKAKESILGK